MAMRPAAFRRRLPPLTWQTVRTAPLRTFSTQNLQGGRASEKWSKGEYAVVGVIASSFFSYINTMSTDKAILEARVAELERRLKKLERNEMAKSVSLEA